MTYRVLTVALLALWVAGYACQMSSPRDARWAASHSTPTSVQPDSPPTTTPTEAATSTASLAAIPTVTSTPGVVAYSLRPGDTLARVAVNAGVPLATLLAFNHLKDDGVVPVGYLLYLPPGSRPPAHWPTPTPRPFSTCTTRQLPSQAPVIRLGRDDRRRVALTFDAGVYPRCCINMAQDLAAHGLRATFFIIGSGVERRPDVVRAIVSSGHELGNHTWSHSDVTGLTAEQLRTELRRTEDCVAQAVPGATTKPFFRAPYGHINEAAQQVVRGEGYYVVGWTVDSLDWVDGVTADEVVWSIARGLRPGAIIELHSSSPATLEVLPAIQALLVAQGYEAVLLSELLAPD